MSTLVDILLPEEYSSIENSVISKLDTAFKKQDEKLVLTTGLYETLKRQHEVDIANLTKQLNAEESKNKCAELTLKVERNRINELQEKLVIVQGEAVHLEAEVTKCEEEVRNYRLKRDEAVDENASLQKSLAKHIKELENLKVEHDELSKKLSAVVMEKAEAISELNELKSRETDLNVKQKQLDSEKSFYIKQIQLLQADVSKYSEQLIEARLQQSYDLAELQSQLSDKNSQIKHFKMVDEDLRKEIKKLSNELAKVTNRLVGRDEEEQKLHEKYSNELDYKTKLADLYKGMSDDSADKTNELVSMNKNLQELLSKLRSEHEDLKTEYEIKVKTNEELIKQKDETISILKQDIQYANDLINKLKEDNKEEMIERMSPHATAAYNLIKKGLSLTELYTEYANVCEQLTVVIKEKEQLNEFVKNIMTDMEAKVPILKQKDKDYEDALKLIANLTRKSDGLEIKYAALEQKFRQTENKNSTLLSENEKQQKNLLDLSRQICLLLNEVEELRTGVDIPKITITDVDLLGDSDDVVTQNLVAFRSIEELQENNRKLLLVVRDLTTSHEEAQEKLKNYNKQELENKIQSLEREKTEIAERYEKIVMTLKDQMEIYKVLNDPSFADVKKETPILCAVSLEENKLAEKVNHMTTVITDAEVKYAAFKEEHLKTENMLVTSLEKAEEKILQLNEENLKLTSRIEVADKNLQSAAEKEQELNAKMKDLNERCRSYFTIMREYELTIECLRQECNEKGVKLAKIEVEVSNLKSECNILRTSNNRLKAERDLLLNRMRTYDELTSTMKLVKESVDRCDTETQSVLKEKLNATLQECSALRKRLEEKQDKYNARISDLEEKKQISQNRLDEEKKENAKLIRNIDKMKNEVKEKDKMIDEIKRQLEAMSSQSVYDLENKVIYLQKELMDSNKELAATKELLTSTKKELDTIAKLSQNFETQLISENEMHIKYKNETIAQLSELTEQIDALKQENAKLNARVEELQNMKQSTIVALNDELKDIKKKYEITAEELSNAKKQLEVAESNMKQANNARDVAEKKYVDKCDLHFCDIKELQKKNESIANLQKQLTAITNERDNAIAKVNVFQSRLEEREKEITTQMEEQNERLKDITAQNEILYKQIEEMNMKLNISQSIFNRSSNDSTLNISSTSSQLESNDENYIQLIQYLKKEKKLALSKLESIQAENSRLQSELKMVKLQLKESHSLLEEEKNTENIHDTTDAKYTELMQKVKMLNTISDSNQILRKERNTLKLQLAEVTEKLDKLETEKIHPLIEENRNLSSQLEALTMENSGYQKECTLWKTRVTKLMEKISKHNLEEITKSLSIERENHNKTLDDLRAVKQEKSRLENQFKKVQSASTTIEKERDELQKQLDEMKSNYEKLNTEFELLKESFATHQSEANKIKTINMQLKVVAKKYKNQYLDVMKTVEEQNKQQGDATKSQPADVAASSAPVCDNSAPVVASGSVNNSTEVPLEEQERLRQEGKQLAEVELAEQTRQLNEQITTKNDEIATLKEQIESLKSKVEEKENRNKDVIRRAHIKMNYLTNEANKYKQQVETVEAATRNEYEARQNVIKSTYENRISKLEKEKADGQVETERLKRELEISSQRFSTLQRQLHSQQNVKSTSVGQEKSTLEPPTANIKPMAGPSSSVTKSQSSQQPVTITPWRSTPVNETPFASIRPRSMQARTAAVLPTSQTACNVSQSTVVVPPQQQLVDTSSSSVSNIVEAFSSSPSSSSHVDYNAPSTSSVTASHNIRQMVVTPTQQTAQSAESTQDLDSDSQSSNQQLTTTAVCSNIIVSLPQQSQLIAPIVSQSQAPTVALVMPRIEMQSVPLIQNQSSHALNAEQQSVVVSSQQLSTSVVSGSNQAAEQSTSSSSSSSSSTSSSSSNGSSNNGNEVQKRSSEIYYQSESDDSNQGQVSASNQTNNNAAIKNPQLEQHQQQQLSAVTSSMETAPEQSIVVASSQQSTLSSSTSLFSSLSSSDNSSNKNIVEPFVTMTNNGNSTVTTTQLTLKRQRESEGESSKSGATTSNENLPPQIKRNRMINVHGGIFRRDIDGSPKNPDTLLDYSGDVEYQVPTSSQMDQEFDNVLMVDSEPDDDLEDEPAMPDDGIIDGDDNAEYDEEEEEEPDNGEGYELEGYDRDDRDMSGADYDTIDDPSIDEDSNQVQDQNNEVEIMSEEANAVPNRSIDNAHNSSSARNITDQQSSEATSSGNNSAAESSNTISHQLINQFSRRSTIISPLVRQQTQQFILSHGFEDTAGDDGIVPSTPTLFVPRRTDGFSEAVSSPHVPSVGQFTFSESAIPTSRAGVAQVISEGMDDTRMDLSQLEDSNNISRTGRSVPSTPVQVSPRGTEVDEVGQSEDNEDLVQGQAETSQSLQEVVEDVLDDPSELEIEEGNLIIDENGDPPEVVGVFEGSNDGATLESSEDNSTHQRSASTVSLHEDKDREAEARSENVSGAGSSDQSGIVTEEQQSIGPVSSQESAMSDSQYTNDSDINQESSRPNRPRKPRGWYSGL